MFSVEELVQPIDAARVSGRDLRYDPVIDTIQEARSEEDDSLPMGDWTRQAKRADYALVAKLSHNALLKESKDLWLAVWLGEATLKLDEYQGLEAVISLLIELHNQFWHDLYPAIEEGDLSLRAAPLHWALSRYAILLQEFPVTGDGIGFVMYKAVRSGNISPPQGEDSLTVEKLDAAIAASPKEFYSEIDSVLARTLVLLEELYLLCEKHYGEDGPSFVSLRTILQELKNLSSQLLRLKQAQEPDTESTTPRSSPVEEKSTTETNAFEQEETPAAFQNPISVAASVATDQEHSVFQEMSLKTWEDAMQQIECCADFIMQQQPTHPAAYLLALVLQYSYEPSKENAPSSEMRLSLKKANEAKNWDDLLKNSFHALQKSYGWKWLDLQRYIWQASQALGANELGSLALMQARFLLENDISIMREFFEDDTPVANPETQEWLTNEVRPPEISSPAKQELQTETPRVSPEIKTDEAEADLYNDARELALRSELSAGIRLLLTQSATKKSARQEFLRRTQVCRLLMESERRDAAIPMLRRLLTEIEEKHLEHWEEPDVLSEPLSLLFAALSPAEAAAEREAIYAHLCGIDPIRAVSLQWGS